MADFSSAAATVPMSSRPVPANADHTPTQLFTHDGNIRWLPLVGHVPGGPGAIGLLIQSRRRQPCLPVSFNVGLRRLERVGLAVRLEALRPHHYREGPSPSRAPARKLTEHFFADVGNAEVAAAHVDLRAACTSVAKDQRHDQDWIAIRQEQEAATACGSLSLGGHVMRRRTRGN
jgi:hypothetical protein